MAIARGKKGVWKEYYIELNGKRREDGSLFVTSPNVSLFSAIVTDDNWNEVLEYLKSYIEANVGPVKEMRLVDDGSELIFSEQPVLPPAHVIAEVDRSRAGTN